MNELITNREIAFGLWLTAFLVGGMFMKQVRVGFALIFHTVFTKAPTAFLFGSATLFIALMALVNAYLFNSARPQISLFLWSITAFAPVIIRLIEIERDISKLWSWVGSFVGLTALAELLTTTHTFSLPVEIIIVPLVLFVSFGYYYTEGKESDRTANGCFLVLLLGFLFAFLVRSIIGVINEPDPFFSWKTLQEFLTPALFGVLAVPYLLIWAAVLRIDNLRTAIRMAVKSPEVRDRALKIAIAHSFLSREQMLAFKREITHARPDDFEELRSAMRAAVETVKRKKEQPPVPKNSGWNPDVARQFLTPLGIKAGPYQRAPWDKNIWFAEVTAKVDEDDFDSPHIWYSIEGAKFCAKSLSLKCTTLSADRRNEARLGFQKAFVSLWQAAMSDQLPEGLDEAVLEFRPFSAQFQGIHVELRHEEEDERFPISEYRLEIEVTAPS